MLEHKFRAKDCHLADKDCLIDIIMRIDLILEGDHSARTSDCATKALIFELRKLAKPELISYLQNTAIGTKYDLVCLYRDSNLLCREQLTELLHSEKFAWEFYNFQMEEENPTLFDQMLEGFDSLIKLVRPAS